MSHEQALSAAAGFIGSAAATGSAAGKFNCASVRAHGNKKRTPLLRGSEIRLFGGEGGGGEADTAKSNQPSEAATYAESSNAERSF